MKISYAICVHNEHEYVPNLLSMLKERVSQFDDEEIVIILDRPDDIMKGIFREYISDNIIVVVHDFKGDFSEHKNYMNSYCSGKYIVNIDADEIPTPALLENLRGIVEFNPLVDVFAVARVNIVSGLTMDHVRKWGWSLTKFHSYTEECVMDDLSEEYTFLKQFNFIIDEIEI